MFFLCMKTYEELSTAKTIMKITYGKRVIMGKPNHLYQTSKMRIQQS